MLKENGKSKRKTLLKCDKCRQRFELIEDEIVKMGEIKYTECPFCGTQQVLKK